MSSSNGYYRDGQDIRRAAFLIREVVTAVIALTLILAAVWQVVVQGVSSSPLVNWGGIVVGVYIGVTHGQSSAALPRRRRSSDPPS